MKPINLKLVSTLVIAVVFSAAGTQAQKSFDGKYDIRKLMAAAQKSFDLSNEDAVFLFDGREVNWSPDGRLETIIHRIIRINTEIAIEHYADHRIPYDDAHCKLDVLALRTWRDGRWWETGPTGKVETLPFRVREAYDYTNMREMMLLHDGVELPCIVEVAYSVKDKEPFRAGAEGLWTFARLEPAVKSLFSLGLPRGGKPNIFTAEEVPEPTRDINEQSGLDTYTWEMNLLKAIPGPRTNDPAAYVPYITWSTWPGWKEYGNHLKTVFESAPVLDDTIKECLDSLLEDARTDGEKANLIVRFINDRTRIIGYPEIFWSSTPRPPVRTYNTAYGHRLDRAVLAAALFRKAGLSTNPVFIGKSYGAIDGNVPSLSRMECIGLWLSGDNLEAYYDPSNGKISNVPSKIYNRPVWRPGVDERPDVVIGDAAEQSLIDVRITLEFDMEKDTLAGTGYLYADNCFSPFDRMVGLKKETKAYLGSVISGLIEGAQVKGYNLTRFDRLGVIVGFEFELDKPKPDDLDRLKFAIGEASGGITDRLPGDMRLFHQKRFSPVYLPGLMNRKVELKLNLKGSKIVYMPSDQTMENEAGKFNISVSREDDRIIVRRELNLAKTIYQPDEWPDLRKLLLADCHERNRTLFLKATDGNNESKEEKEVANR
jgi:hypothetical protein